MATATPATRILRLKAVLARVPVNESTIWRWEQLGQFPKRVKLGPNAVGWCEHEVEAWLQSKRTT